MSAAASAMPVFPKGTAAIPPVAAQVPAAGVAAVATLTTPSDATGQWRLDTIRWSYSGTPTGGSVTVAWFDVNTASNVSEVLYVTGAGPGFLPWNKYFPPGQSVTITLAAGGSGVTGTIYVDAECSG